MIKRSWLVQRKIQVKSDWKITKIKSTDRISKKYWINATDLCIEMNLRIFCSLTENVIKLNCFFFNYKLSVSAEYFNCIAWEELAFNEMKWNEIIAEMPKMNFKEMDNSKATVTILIRLPSPFRTNIYTLFSKSFITPWGALTFQTKY